MADLEPTNVPPPHDDIVSKNMHATDAPLKDSVAEKLGFNGNMHATTEPIDGSAGTATTDNMHATTELTK